MVIVVVVIVIIIIVHDLLLIFECFLNLHTLYIFLNIEIDNLLKVLVSIRKNVANPDDLGSMMKSIGVPLPQDVIERALKNVALTGEYLMFLGILYLS